jgi:hypothetical protein
MAKSLNGLTWRYVGGAACVLLVGLLSWFGREVFARTDILGECIESNTLSIIEIEREVAVLGATLDLRLQRLDERTKRTAIQVAELHRLIVGSGSPNSEEH